MSDIHIISIDGLNRSGKGTQLRLLKEHYIRCGVPVQVVRGDGSREGVGGPYSHDPMNAWWRQWQRKPVKTAADWNRAYAVLTRESAWELQWFSREHDVGYFLMDRCYLSRWFTERQRNPRTPLPGAPARHRIVPHLSFVLDVPKAVLLTRRSSDNPRKASFRRAIVERWYDLWVETMAIASGILGDALVRIDGTRDPRLIHEDIRAHIESRFGQTQRPRASASHYISK